jgi:hypothetical protein
MLRIESPKQVVDGLNRLAAEFLLSLTDRQHREISPQSISQDAIAISASLTLITTPKRSKKSIPNSPLTNALGDKLTARMGKSLTV